MGCEGARHGVDPGQENSSAQYSHKEGCEHPRVPWHTGVLFSATLRLNHTLDANYSHRSKLCATRNRQQRLLWRRCCLVSESLALGACIAVEELSPSRKSDILLSFLRPALLDPGSLERVCRSARPCSSCTRVDARISRWKR